MSYLYNPIFQTIIFNFTRKQTQNYQLDSIKALNWKSWILWVVNGDFYLLPLDRGAVIKWGISNKFPNKHNLGFHSKCRSNVPEEFQLILICKCFPLLECDKLGAKAAQQ